MSAHQRRPLIIFSLVILLAFALTSSAGAKELWVSSVPNGETGEVIQILCNGSEQLDAYTIVLQWDPAVMNVTAVTNLQPQVFPVFLHSPVPHSKEIIISGLSVSLENLSGDNALFSITANAMVQDGHWTWVSLLANESMEIGENGVSRKDQYILTNGTFTTADHVPPTITITTPDDGSTVPQTVNVAATITDVGGVDQSSIRISVGGIEITNPTIAPIANGYFVTAQREDVPLGSNVPVEVYAKDLADNNKTVTHYVTVAKPGITFASPASGTYTNETQPVILANFVKVDSSTIRMFINEDDVTAFCDISAGTDGSIALNYTSYALADDAYHIVVNGTNALVLGQVESDEVSFVKDTIAPTVTITKILDSDYDGFPEAGEWLYVYYTAIDANLGDVWFDNGCNTTGIRDGFAIANISTGNKKVVAYAEDRAGNIGNSTPVHIYNNNLVYFNDPSLGSFAGLDLTTTALYDIFSTARSFILTGPNAQMSMPALGQFDKTITGGSNVTIDCRKNDPIPAGSLPDAIGIYTTPAGALDFAVCVPNVTNATLMIAKVNSTLIDQLIADPSEGALEPGMLKDLLDSKKIVLYGKEGYAIINVDDDSFESVGIIQVTPSNLPKTIHTNYVDLNAGFNTATTPYGSTPLQISKLGQGEYALLAVCMDDDRFAIVSASVFMVTEKAGVLSTSAATYAMGQPVVVNSQQSGGAISAVVLNSSAFYTGNVTLNFSTLGKDSFESAYLFADGNQTFVKPFGKANLWLSKGYGSASVAKNAASVSVPTHDLHPGDYRVYMFLEDKGNVTSYGETTIQITPAGSIHVTSAPPGATIYLDGTDTGKVTNGTLTAVPEGSHNVTVTLAGYAPASRQVQVGTGGTVLVHFDLVPLPVANFTASVISGPVPLTVQFTDTSTGAPTSRSWNFGDGNTSSVQNPVHTYTSIGRYNVTLTATNSAGSDTLTRYRYITVQDVPPDPARNETSRFHDNGTTVETVNGQQQVTFNQTASNGTVSGNDIHLSSGILNVTIQTSGLTMDAGGNMTGNVTGILLESNQPLNASLPNIGNVSVAFNASMNGYNPDLMISTAIYSQPSSQASSAFTLAATNANLDITATAYAIYFTKTNLGANDTISNAVLQMTVSRDWVTAQGGPEQIRIFRQGDDGNVNILTPTWRVDPDDNTMLIFEAFSPDGFSAFAIAATKSTVSPTPTPRPSGGGGGGGGSTVSTYTGTGTLLTGSSGTVLKSVIVNAADNVGSMFVPIGTTALDANGKPLGEIDLKPLAGDAVPAVPSGSVFKFAGYAYEAGPDGATFDPAITLSLDIPEDVWNSLDLTNQQCMMKWYNKESGLWEDVPTTIIPGTRTVEIRITHFSIYALFTEPVTTPTTPTETVTTATPATPTTPTAPPAEGLSMTMILAIFAVIAIIVVAGYFLMMRK